MLAEDIESGANPKDNHVAVLVEGGEEDPAKEKLPDHLLLARSDPDQVDPGDSGHGNNYRFGENH